MSRPESTSLELSQSQTLVTLALNFMELSPAQVAMSVHVPLNVIEFMASFELGNLLGKLFPTKSFFFFFKCY